MKNTDNGFLIAAIPGFYYNCPIVEGRKLYAYIPRYHMLSKNPPRQVPGEPEGVLAASDDFAANRLKCLIRLLINCFSGADGESGVGSYGRVLLTAFTDVFQVSD